MKIKKIIPVILVLIMILSSCQQDVANTSSEVSQPLPECFIYINGEKTLLKAKNDDKITEGITLFDAEYQGNVAVASGTFFDVIVIGTIAIEVGEESDPLIIPKCNGFLARFFDKDNLPKAGDRITLEGIETKKDRDTEKLYDYTYLTTDGKDLVRRSGQTIVYTKEFADTTMTNDGGLEVIVDASGTITEITDKGDNKIGDGFVISADTDASQKLSESALIGGKAVIANDGTSIMIIRTPLVYASVLNNQRLTLQGKIDSAKADFLSIDYDSLEKAVSDMETTYNDFVSSYETDRNNSAEHIKKAMPLINAEYDSLFYPTVTLQSREAWVTAAEYDYSGNRVIHFKSENDVKIYIELAKKAGLNGLVIDGMGCGYAMYKSDIPGVVMMNELNGFDMIESFSRNCRENGLQLKVMICAFYGGMSTETFPQEHYVNIFKDKRLLSLKGNDATAEHFVTLNPYDKEVRKFFIDVMREIAEKYSPNGVQVDYIRFPLPIGYQDYNYDDFGYNDDIVNAFKKQYGYSPKDMTINDSRWINWCNFRSEIITSYVKEVYENIKAVDNDIEVSFTCFADANDRKIYVYQDIAKWVDNGWADAVYPMIYADTTEGQLGYADAIVKLVGGKTKLMLGIGAYVKATEQSMCEQCYMSYELGVQGVCIFTLRYIDTCGYMEALSTGSFSKPATRTDLGIESFNAGVLMLKERIENVYKRFYPNEAGLTKLSEQLESTDASSVLGEGLQFNDESLKTAVTHDIEYLLSCLK